MELTWDTVIIESFTIFVPVQHALLKIHTDMCRIYSNTHVVATTTINVSLAMVWLLIEGGSYLRVHVYMYVPLLILD